MVLESGGGSAAEKFNYTRESCSDKNYRQEPRPVDVGIRDFHEKYLPAISRHISAAFSHFRAVSWSQPTQGLAIHWGVSL